MNSRVTHVFSCCIKSWFKHFQADDFNITVNKLMFMYSVSVSRAWDRLKSYDRVRHGSGQDTDSDGV